MTDQLYHKKNPELITVLTTVFNIVLLCVILCAWYGFAKDGKSSKIPDGYQYVMQCAVVSLLFLNRVYLNRA